MNGARRLLRRLAAMLRPRPGGRAQAPTPPAAPPARPVSTSVVPDPATPILDRLLAGVPADRTPTDRQRAALRATLANALVGGFRRDELTAVLLRWDTDPLQVAYPLIRRRLAVMCSGAGYVCPICLGTSPVDGYNPIWWCRRCRRDTGAPDVPPPPGEEVRHPEAFYYQKP